MIKEIEITDDAYRKDMILVSALFHTQPPDGHARAKCERVLYHALVAAKCWDDALEKHQNAVFHGIYDDFQIIARWYGTLIKLVTHKPESDRLLDGAGNFGAGVLDEAAGPSFTDCWLTSAGKLYAEQLLTKRPELRSQFVHN